MWNHRAPAKAVEVVNWRKALGFELPVAKPGSTHKERQRRYQERKRAGLVGTKP